MTHSLDRQRLITDTEKMKIALVHDWLNAKNGGAEQVLFALAKLYPEAPIYTLIYNQSKFAEFIAPGRIRTSFLQKLPQVLKNRPHYLLPLIPMAIESFNFDEFDIVLSSSAAFSKNILTSPSTYHICYCHSPMRFAWDYWPQYLHEQSLGPIRRFTAHKQISRVRQWDYLAASRVDKWLANSKNVGFRITKYYRQDAEIIYPPVDTAWFNQANREKKDYFVTISALTPYKKIDLAIEAFNINGERLIVLGEGKDKPRLEKMARSNIEFAGFVETEKKRELLGQAKGLIFPQEEDFGIAAVEAMASGTPVISYGAGGVLETVIDGQTGVFFDAQTPGILNQAVARANSLKFDCAMLKHQADNFNQSIFNRKIKTVVSRAYQNVHSD